MPGGGAFKSFLGLDPRGEQDVVLFVNVNMRVTFKVSDDSIAFFPDRACMLRRMEIIGEFVNSMKRFADIVMVVNHAIDRPSNTPRRSALNFRLAFEALEPGKQHALLADEMVMHVIGQ